MSDARSSYLDNVGSGNKVIYARSMDDIATFDTDHWVLNRGSPSIHRVANFAVTAPILITANDTLRMFQDVNGDAQFFYINPTVPLFYTLPLNEGEISSITVATTTATVTTTVAHNMISGDIVKIMDSRIGELNGNKTITSAGATTFQFTVESGTLDDTRCMFKQVEISFSASTNDAGNVSITITAHPFAVGDWINITDSTDLDGDHEITATATNSITFVDDSTTTQSGFINTAANTIGLYYERFNRYNSGTVTTAAHVFNIQGKRDFTTLTSHATLYTDRSVTGGISTATFWQMGEVRDCRKLDFVVSGSIFFNATGMKNYGCDKFLVTDFLSFNDATATITEDYNPLFMNGEGSDSVAMTITGRDMEMVEFQSICTIPSTVSSGFRALLTNIVPGPSPGDYFSAGYNVVSSGAIVDAGSGTITIPISDTIQLRVADDITIIDSTTVTAGTLNEIILIDGGTGYSVSDTITLVGGTSGSGATANVDSVSGGIITGVTILVVGSSYVVDEAITVTGGTGGDDATFTVESIGAGYEGLTGTIQSIIADTSIVVDIPFIAADSGVLISNTSMASKDQTDPQVIAINNDGLKNSMSVGETALSADVSIASGSMTLDVWVAINGGNWIDGFIERFLENNTDGELVYTGLEDADFIVNWSVTVTGSNANFACQLGPVVNPGGITGTESTPLEPPSYVGTTLTQLSGSSLVTLTTDDVIALSFIPSNAGSGSTVFSQAHLTIIKGG